MNDFFMSESTLDLFEEYQAEQFALEMEAKASELEIPVDYYMMEFMDVEE